MIGVPFVLVLAGLSLLAATAPARAPSPLVAELEAAAQNYHQDPPRLDRLREGLGRVAAETPTVEDLIALARAEFLWADVRATSSDEKLAAYDRGRQAARRAVDQSPKNALAHLWYAVNTARWGQTRGILNSLSLLPAVKEEIGIVLELDPTLPGAYSLAGNVFYEVPRLLGGDLKKAEEMFRKGLEYDPHFTGLRVGLGKTLIRQGRVAEGRRELQAVLDEKEPRSLADWTVKDAKEARAILAGLRSSTPRGRPRPSWRRKKRSTRRGTGCPCSEPT
jgi:tetratricopeptide (TPR) repeat protein